MVASSAVIPTFAFPEYNYPISGPSVQNMLYGADLHSSGNAAYAAKIGVDYNVSPNRPADKIDTIAIGIYFYGAQTPVFQVQNSANWKNNIDDLLTAADNYASGIPSQMSAALDWIDNDTKNGMINGAAGIATLAALKPNISGWNNTAATLQKSLAMYESAYSSYWPTATIMTNLGHSTAYVVKIRNLIIAYRNDVRCYSMYLEFWNWLMGLSNFLQPCWYVSGSNDPWALFSSSLYSAPYKIYDAIKTWTSQR